MSLFGKVLVANRGEIALRVMRTCREKGIGTVAIYSRADQGSLHVRHADHACCVGEADARDSYMNVPNIVCAALELGADAVHPGYGFLAEDARFAAICSAHGLSFIGPSADALLLAGDKCRMRAVAEGCGVPVLPATDGPISRQDVLRKAREVGYPLVLKPRCGGGGRGIRYAADEDDLTGLLVREVRASLESGRSFLEHCLQRPRHIEVQVLADSEGDARAIGLRDCSVQRSRQKIIEEAPPPRLDRGLEKRLARDALRLSTASGFSTAGTVEFLVKGDDYYFIELNPRIQVEHTVTEVLTGLDLVWEQIRLAGGSALGRPSPTGSPGHAIQARIYAERPGTMVGDLRLPGGPGVRVDTHLRRGCLVPYFYDPLLAKVIVVAPTRGEAIIRLRRALDETRIEGVETNLSLLEALLESAAFEEGRYHTGLVDELEEGGCPPGEAQSPAGARAGNRASGGRRSLTAATSRDGIEERQWV